MMTEEQRKLCHGLVVWPDGRTNISKEEFVRQFPSALEHGKVALGLIEDACRARDGGELECALTIGAVFGFPTDAALILSELLLLPWHKRHEDIALTLQHLRVPSTVDVLAKAALVKYDHLAYDDSHAFARKCTWALADIGTLEARAHLERLARADDTEIAAYAQKRLDNWEVELHRKGPAARPKPIM